MAQYIDKAAVVAEIERRIKEVSQIGKASYEIGLCDAYKIVLRFLDTLEVKEVNLDGEIDLWVRNLHRVPNFEELNKFARHFFELGTQQSKNYKNNEE